MLNVTVAGRWNTGSHTPSRNDRIQHGCKIFSAALPLDSARIRAGLQYNTSSLLCVCLPVLFHVSVMRKRKGSADHDSSFTGTLLEDSSDLKQCHRKTDAASDPGGAGTAMGRRYRRWDWQLLVHMCSDVSASVSVFTSGKLTQTLNLYRPQY